MNKADELLSVGSRDSVLPCFVSSTVFACSLFLYIGVSLPHKGRTVGGMFSCVGSCAEEAKVIGHAQHVFPHGLLLLGVCGDVNVPSVAWFHFSSSILHNHSNRKKK